jgi:hypothetical protein
MASLENIVTEGKFVEYKICATFALAIEKVVG